MIRKWSELESVPLDLKTFDLNAFYDELNGKYFEGSLPKIPVKLGRGTKQFGFVSARVITTRSGEIIVEDMSMTINGTFKFTKDTLERVMCHEMIHVELFTKKVIRDVGHPSHGLYFKSKVKELKLKGIDVPLSEDMKDVLDTNLSEVPPFLVLLTEREPGEFSVAKTQRGLYEEAVRNDASFLSVLSRYGWTRGRPIIIGISTNPRIKVPTSKSFKTIASYPISEQLYKECVETLQRKVVMEPTPEGVETLKRREEARNRTRLEREKHFEEYLRKLQVQNAS